MVPWARSLAPAARPRLLDAARVPFAWRAVCVHRLGRSGSSRFSGLGLAATVARKRKLPAANTITSVSYIPPFLMWQLSAYHSSQCQGNHGGGGWRWDGRGMQASHSLSAKGGRSQDPPPGRIPRASSPKVLLRADPCSFLPAAVRTSCWVVRFPWA